MPTIEKRTTPSGKTTYRAKVRLKNCPSKSATFDKLSDAKNWSQRIEVELKAGKFFAREYKFSELITRYLKEIMPRKKEKSINTQRSQLLWWNKHLGNYLLSDLTTAILGECRSKLFDEKGNNDKKKEATINSYSRALSHCFTMAVKEWEWMKENPMLKISSLKEPRGRTRFLSDTEKDNLLAACKNSSCDVLYILVVLAISTGARKMEILGLSWGDVNLDRGVITLYDTKNGDIRSIPLVGMAKLLMEEFYIDRNPETELVFPSKKNINKPIDIRKPFQVALIEAHIYDFKWHDLRHSAASYLAMNGASLTEIADVLGHKTLNMVKRYSHLSDSHTKGVVERMNAKVFG